MVDALVKNRGRDFASHIESDTGVLRVTIRYDGIVYSHCGLKALSSLARVLKSEQRYV
jgi:hypothetical protein